MSVPVLLITLITVNLVASEGSLPIRLQAKVLQPDLDAISNYYANIDNSLVGYIHWPESILFRVQLYEENYENYIKVDGTFARRNGDSLAQIFSSNDAGPEIDTYDCLYYKDGEFYVKTKPEEPPFKISPEVLLYYMKQPDMTDDEAHLSIWYFGDTEMKEVVHRMYDKKRSFYDVVLPKNPATFLLTMHGQHFLEYTFPTDGKLIPSVEGNLRVLIGKRKSIPIRRNIETSRLLFDPKNNFKCTTDAIHSKDFYHMNVIFGVRMASVGFLAEHRGSAVRMLGSDDISGGSGNLDQHIVSANDFLGKVENVEPRVYYPESGSMSELRVGKLQMKGHVLIKRVNNVYNVMTTEETFKHPQCRLIVEFENKESYFLLGSSNDRVDKICTDDISLWVDGVDYYIDCDITLVRK